MVVETHIHRSLTPHADMQFRAEQIAPELRPLQGADECVAITVRLPNGESGTALVTRAALVAADLWSGQEHRRAHAIARALNTLARGHPECVVIQALTREPETERWLIRTVL